MTYQIISERKAPTYKIGCPADAYKAFARYARAKTERFIVASLNGSHEIIRIRIVTVGLARISHSIFEYCKDELFCLK